MTVTVQLSGSGLGLWGQWGDQLPYYSSLIHSLHKYLLSAYLVSSAMLPVWNKSKKFLLLCYLHTPASRGTKKTTVGLCIHHHYSQWNKNTNWEMVFTHQRVKYWATFWFSFFIYLDLVLMAFLFISNPVFQQTFIAHSLYTESTIVNKSHIYLLPFGAVQTNF